MLSEYVTTTDDVDRTVSAIELDFTIRDLLNYLLFTFA